MAFKIAYCAGHYINTPGKRLHKSFDPDETREWVLNDRVADHFAKAAAEYEGVELLRTDDPLGMLFIDIPERTAKANAWRADLYVDIHHNAAGKVFSGGGVEVFSYPGAAASRRYRDVIYAEIISAGGIKGDRSKPLQEKAYDTLAMTRMPAVLIEYGYMDSSVDAPIILTDLYAKKVAYGTMAGIAKVAGLSRKAVMEAMADYTLEQFVKDIQRATGSRVDGVAGKETIGNTITVSESKNRKHEVVSAVQKRLHALGYTTVGNADGVAGPKFTAAVIAFQEANHCWVDGEITAENKTWRKLLGME